MIKKISQKNITNIKNKEFITRMMSDSVNKCFEEKLFVPALTLICCFIDGLGNGTKKDYIHNLQQHFPDLCKELGAQTFYKKYRNGIIHEFCMKGYFALDRDENMDSQYIQEKKVVESEKILTSLNIDRLTKDFLNWVKEERSKK